MSAHTDRERALCLVMVLLGAGIFAIGVGEANTVIQTKTARQNVSQRHPPILLAPPTLVLSATFIFPYFFSAIFIRHVAVVFCGAGV